MKQITEGGYRDSIYKGIRNGVIGIAVICILFGVYKAVKIYRNSANPQPSPERLKISQNTLDSKLD